MQPTILNIWIRFLILPDQKPGMGCCISVWPGGAITNQYGKQNGSRYPTWLMLLLPRRVVMPSLKVDLPLFGDQRIQATCLHTPDGNHICISEISSAPHLQVILRMPRDMVGPFFFFSMKSSSNSWVFSRWLYVNFTNLCGFLEQVNWYQTYKGVLFTTKGFNNETLWKGHRN